MITFKINKKPYQIPTYWSDVTYRQYLELLKATSITDQIAIFTDVPRETLQQAELKNLESIAIALSFLSVAPKFEFSRMVGPYLMPVDITIQSTGQFEDLRGLLMKLPKDDVELRANPEQLQDLYLHACAIYCQKIRDGKYDPDKVIEVKEELKGYPVTEVCGTGAFFLFRPVNLSRGITRRFLTAFQHLKNMIQVWLIYPRILVSRLRYSGRPGK